MTKPTLKQRLAAGQTLIGTWLSIPHPIAVEAMSGIAFDFIQIDGEHAPIHPDTLYDLLPAAGQIGIETVYRARRNRDDLISAALDAGVPGIMVPMVNTKAEAEAAVAAAKYPPHGKRGFGPWRASDYYRKSAEYLRNANADILVAVQIETAGAVNNVEAIASVPGLDLLYIGPADLALSLGVEIGSWKGPMDKAYAKVAKACSQHGKFAGTDLPNLDSLPRLIELGFRYFTHGGDLTYLTAGAETTGAQLRERIG